MESNDDMMMENDNGLVTKAQLHCKARRGECVRAMIMESSDDMMMENDNGLVTKS